MTLRLKSRCKRTQHCLPTTPNIVGCYTCMSRPFAYPVACCCVQVPTFFAQQCCELLRPFALCFRDKTAPNFSRLHCLVIPGRDLSTKKTKLNIQKWPENLGVMLDYRTWAIGDLQKSKFSFLETSLQWFPLAEFLKCRHFFEWNSWRWRQSLSKKKKKICFLVSMSSINKFMREQTLLVVRHLAQGSKNSRSVVRDKKIFFSKL